MRMLAKNICPATLIGMALLLAGCNAADETRERVRRYFEIPAGQKIVAETIRAAILATVPPGSGTDEVYAYLKRRGIGNDGLSSWYPAEDGRIVCRVDDNPETLGLVKQSFGIFFLLDQNGKLKDVEAREWLTGP